MTDASLANKYNSFHYSLRLRARRSTERIHTEITRYLCAAVHLDENFRRYVIENIVEEEYRSVGELHGIDIIAVVKWCFDAWERELKRDRKLFLLVIILFLVEVPSIILLLSQPSFTFFAIIIPLVLVVIFFILAWRVVALDRISIYYGKRAEQLTKRNFNGNSIQIRLDASLEEKLKSISQESNLIVYSGYSPFASAGQNIGSWSFAIDISKGKEGIDGAKIPIPFTCMEIYNDVARNIDQLELDNLVIEGKLFVNGKCIREDKRFLNKSLTYPHTWVDMTLMHQFLEHPEQDIRYYQCIRITSWRGELILSLFLRFVQLGNNLFVEADYLLLPPLKEEYFKIDTIDPTLTGRKKREVVAQTFTETIGLWWCSPSKIMHSWLYKQSLNDSYVDTETAILDNPVFDYGCVGSLRQAVATTNYQRHFQKLDKEIYVTIITQRLLRSITTFLDKRDIDTSSLRKREETILNNGVLITGSSIIGENVAIGKQSTATYTNGAEAT